MCWKGKILKCNFMLLKPRLITSECEYRRSNTLKNRILVRKQHPEHRVHLVNYNIHVVSGFNSTSHSNYRITNILLPKSSQIRLHVSQLEPGIQEWVFSKHKPSLMLGTT
jgi:hypothetical protein